MAYIPKSQYEIKSTNGGDLVNPKTGRIYVGSYIQYGTKYFAGNNPNDLSIGLNKINLNEKNLILTDVKRNFDFNELNNKFYNQIKNQAPPISIKPTPTEKNYEAGFWKRYFYQRVTDINLIFETDKANYDKLRGNILDGNLYKPGKITWSLISKEENIINVLKTKRKFLYIDTLFNDPEEFINNPTENLTAGLNELFYSDGTPYPEGAKYHIHPEKGPMEGAFHINEPHSLLFFDNPQMEENELIPYISTPPPQPQTQIEAQPSLPQLPPPSYGGGSSMGSSGGSGGY